MIRVCVVCSIAELMIFFSLVSVLFPRQGKKTILLARNVQEDNGKIKMMKIKMNVNMIHYMETQVTIGKRQNKAFHGV